MPPEEEEAEICDADRGARGRGNDTEEGIVGRGRMAGVHGAATVAGGKDAWSRQTRPAGQEQSSNHGGTCASMKSSSNERLQERA